MSKLKRFFIGYFSNKDLTESGADGLLGAMLSLFLALAIIFCGILGGEFLPFKSRYAKAEGYKSTLSAVFSDLSLKISDGKAEIRSGAENLSDVKAVDTFSVAADREKYGEYGYEVVVDTRPTALTFDDFLGEYVSEDGTRLSAEEYRALADGLKAQFKFEITYTGKTLTLDALSAAKYEKYVSSANDETKKALMEIKLKNLGEAEYRAAVYELYFKAYYPAATTFESDGGAPKVRNFYQQEYIKAKCRKYLFIFTDSFISGFVDADGRYESVYGVFSGMDGVAVSSASDAENFISASLRSSRSLVVYNAFVSYLNMAMFYVLLWFVAALFSLFIGKWLSINGIITYGGHLRLTGSLWLWTSVFTALLTMAFGFITPKGKTPYVALLVFFCLIVVRLALYFVVEKIALNRLEEDEEIVAE